MRRSDLYREIIEDDQKRQERLRTLLLGCEALVGAARRLVEDIGSGVGLNGVVPAVYGVRHALASLDADALGLVFIPAVAAGEKVVCHGCGDHLVMGPPTADRASLARCHPCSKGYTNGIIPGKEGFHVG